ncbi:MAG: DUF6273 domain-containing protein [Treponema sp.]|jgi:hypothetical protein|nr:DUF6273 domain-containing protein [Treponema sp.]
MAFLPEESVWSEGIYQLEVEDGPEGGPEGIDNVPLKQLADRTVYLKENLSGLTEKVGASIPDEGGIPLSALAQGVKADIAKGKEIYIRVSNHAKSIGGMGRDILEVLGISTSGQSVQAAIQEAMGDIRELSNHTESGPDPVPDYQYFDIGDYLDYIDLSAIPAENGGTAGQPWNDSYKNTRIVLSAFNPYKGVGDTEVTKNHLRFDFANVPLRKRMNPINDNTGGYPATEMRAFLDGVNGDGTGDRDGVTTAAFLNALKAQIGDYILPVRRLLSNKVDWAWVTCSLWLPSENEIFGANAWGEAGYGDGQKLHIPLYRDSYAHRIKRYNGSRDWYWLNSPYSGSAAYFCNVSGDGYANFSYASAVGGCAPAFCVA